MSKGVKINLEFGLEDYFRQCISAVSSFQPRDFKLTPTEIEFLTVCCMLKYLGHDIGDLDVLEEGIKNHYPNKNFTKRSTISQYKTRISSKKFIKVSRGNIVIPGILFPEKAINKGEATFTLNFKWMSEDATT